MEERNDFAEKFSFFKLFLFFVFGCFFGAIFEGVIMLVQNGEWMNRGDLIYGPFSTLYGFGVVLYLVLLGPHNSSRGIVKTFFYSAFIGGVAEYLAGFLSEMVLHIKFWDYSHMILNFQGRTTIPIMCIWGVMGTLLLKIIYPFFSKWIEKIPRKIGNVIVSFLFLFFLFDMLLSYSAFFRMLERNKGHKPITFLGEVYDKIYPDEFMYQKFPILDGKFES